MIAGWSRGRSISLDPGTIHPHYENRFQNKGSSGFRWTMENYFNLIHLYITITSITIWSAPYVNIMSAWIRVQYATEWTMVPPSKDTMENRMTVCTC